MPLANDLTISCMQDLVSVKDNEYPLFLACSGGLDSMALLHLAASYAKSCGIRLEVLHVNYGLRGSESDGDALFVEETADRLKLPFHLLKAGSNPKGTVGIQAWARQLRFDWFEKMTKAGGKVLLAHHRDDLIETILMRIVRGSSLQSLMGMQKREGRYLRPLLDYSRQTIQEYVQREGIAYREDSSNARLDYSRNRLRHMILPELESMFPGAGRNLLELAKSGQEWTEYFETSIKTREAPETASDWKDIGFYPASQWIVSSLGEFLNEEFSATKPSRAWLESVYEALCSGTTTVLQMDEGVSLELSGGQFRFTRSLARSVSSRWLQYKDELTKSGLASRLSPGARLDLELDEGPEMQDNKNAGERSK